VNYQCIISRHLFTGRFLCIFLSELSVYHLKTFVYREEFCVPFVYILWNSCLLLYDPNARNTPIFPPDISSCAEVFTSPSKLFALIFDSSFFSFFPLFSFFSSFSYSFCLFFIRIEFA